MSQEGLERYQVMDPLGEGGQGTTYRGVDRATNRDVAIKVLSLKGKQNWKSFDLFEREVQVLKSLDHPRVPRYIDSFASEASGDFFLVMSLVEGKPLSTWIDEGRRMPKGALRKLLDDALAILEYLHGLTPPVVHRDIKPANLLMTEAGELSLVDFGGVRLAARGSGGSTMIGTFGYMAPEQLHGEATQAVDIYALGATIAAIAAGCEADTLPHDGLRLDVGALEVSPALREVLGRMLEPDPRARLASVTAVRSALERRARPRLAPPAAADPAPVGALARRESAAAVQVERDIPLPMQSLARAPFPFSFLVWLVSSIASGTLVVAEVVLLPLIATVALAINRNSRKPERQEKLEANIEEMRETVAGTRRAFGWVADRTSPVSDRALPPGKK